MIFHMTWEYHESWLGLVVLGIFLFTWGVATLLPRIRIHRICHNPLADIKAITAAAAEEGLPVQLCSGSSAASTIQPQDAVTLDIAHALDQRATRANTPVCQLLGSAPLYCTADTLPNLELIPLSDQSGIAFVGASNITAGLEAAETLESTQARSLIMWGNVPIENLFVFKQRNILSTSIVGAVNPANAVLLAASSDKCVMGEDALALGVEETDKPTPRLFWHDLIRSLVITVIIVASILAT